MSDEVSSYINLEGKSSCPLHELNLLVIILTLFRREIGTAEFCRLLVWKYYDKYVIKGKHTFATEGSIKCVGATLVCTLSTTPSSLPHFDVPISRILLPIIVR